MLSVARIAGETAPLIMTILGRRIFRGRNRNGCTSINNLEVVTLPYDNAYVLGCRTSINYNTPCTKHECEISVLIGKEDLDHWNIYALQR